MDQQQPMDTSVASHELPSFRRQLDVLRYPYRDDFDVYSDARVKSLVLWMEDNVFQYLQDAEKIALQKQEGHEWRTNAFHDVKKKRAVCVVCVCFFSFFFVQTKLA